MKIVVLDGHTLNPGDNPWTGVAALGDLTVHDRTPDDQIVARARAAQVVLTNKTPISAATLDQLPELRFIAVLATGYNVVDVRAARARDLPVSNVPVYGTDSVAQYTFALLLELCHHVGRHREAVRAGGWEASGEFSFWETPLVELGGRTMGVVGFGRIGRRVGELAHAFGMEVLAHDVMLGDPPTYAPFGWADIEELFATADVVSLHCPQTEDNARFVNQELLARMKPGAYLINTARGGLIDEAALTAAVNSGQLAGAAVDVVSAEPIAPDNPLLACPNVIITPHMAWATLAARRRLMDMTVDNVKAFLDGDPINVVN